MTATEYFPIGENVFISEALDNVFDKWLDIFSLRRYSPIIYELSGKAVFGGRGYMGMPTGAVQKDKRRMAKAIDEVRCLHG